MKCRTAQYLEEIPWQPCAAACVPSRYNGFEWTNEYVRCEADTTEAQMDCDGYEPEGEFWRCRWCIIGGDVTDFRCKHPTWKVGKETP